MTTPRTRGRLRAATLAATLAAASLTALTAATSAAAAAPPWTSPSDPNHDPSAVGTLAFYDASGTQIFSGTLSDIAPFAAYVVGSTPIRSGDTAAFLTGYQPVAGKPEAGWSGVPLTPAVRYPNAAAPGALASGSPLYTASAADTSLTDLAHAFPTSDGVYELRLRTSAPGLPTSDQYDAAVVKVTGTTWQALYPSNIKDTSTTLGTTTSGTPTVGRAITLTVTVSPSSAGTVQFQDGATNLGTPVSIASGGTATKVVTPTTGGTHHYSAVFTPQDSNAFAGSTGSATVTVAKAASTTRGTWPAVAHYGTAFTVRAVVTTATGAVPTGTVTLVQGARALAHGTVAAGSVTLHVGPTLLLPGSHPLTLRYGGSDGALGSASVTHPLTVAKAVSSTTNTLVRRTIRKGTRPSLVVNVRAPGVVPTGTVTVYDSARAVSHVALKAAQHGRVTVTLPAATTVGRHSVHAVYQGSSTTGASSARAVVLTVTK